MKILFVKLMLLLGYGTVPKFRGKRVAIIKAFELNTKADPMKNCSVSVKGGISCNELYGLIKGMKVKRKINQRKKRKKWFNNIIKKYQ